MVWLFRAYGLAAGHNNGFINIFGEAAAREVVDGCCEALEYGAYGLYAAETLHELVCDVAYFERGEDEYVGTTAQRAVGRLAVCYRGHEGCVGLQLAVEDECGVELVCELCGFNHLIHALALGRTFGGE